MKKLLMILFIGFVFITAAQAKLIARVDRTQIAPGETFTLTLTTAAGSAGVPELSMLDNDFTVLGTGQASQVTIINGTRQATLTWQIVLSPKHSGQITIPAIRAGNQLSQPISITVSNAVKTATHSSHAAYLKASVDTKNPYVQAQVVYRLKLYYRDMGNGRLTEPTADNAVILRLGQDKHYQASLAGRSYEVLERDYAIFPQRSGKLVIQPAVFTGISLDEPSAYRGADPFFSQMGKPIRLISPEITLNVKSIPAAVQNNTWLPAQRLTLNQSWSPTNSEFKVGDPITRTITIQAEGLTAAQLPDLAQTDITNTNNYPNKPITSETLDGTAIIAKRIEKTAYIPTQAGQLTLPEVTLSWWNTQTDKLVTARLPAKSFTILAASGNSPAASTPQPTTSTVTPSNTLSPQASDNQHYPLWFWVAIGLLLMWIVTLIIWWQRSRKQQAQPANLQNTSNIATVSVKHTLQQIKTACQQHDYANLPNYLITWAQQQWPQQSPQSLQAIAALCPKTPLATQLSMLDKHLYGHRKTKIDLSQLWSAVSQYKASKQRDNTAVDLPPLYPDSKGSIL